ncbi:2734_t:CDS:2 [Racocetra fulgida]|uniref:2734_t:CDS:1 n=1 Tax=Racocetra fulgida TaxID=60492 RepID=A0A9N9EED4_9GLOM|nr:2734_t:CDS:2 [Racocetra fulgida]
MEVHRIEIEEKPYGRRNRCKGVPERIKKKVKDNDAANVKRVRGKLRKNGGNGVNYVKKKSRVVNMTNKMDIDKKRPEKHIPDDQMVNLEVIESDVNIRHMDFDGWDRKDETKIEDLPGVLPEIDKNMPTISHSAYDNEKEPTKPVNKDEIPCDDVAGKYRDVNSKMTVFNAEYDGMLVLDDVEKYDKVERS